MKLHTTKDKTLEVSLKEAVLRGLPPDNGLYMPNDIPKLPASFFEQMSRMSFQEIAFQVCRTLLQDAIPENDLKVIIDESINFPAPVVKLTEQLQVLELFHGPSLAFKDFGARFMAQLMSYFNRGNDTELVILVATSGDTGGAVAAGFYKTPGIKVVILYPSGKVSDLQEKQLTTLGHNITALEVDGTFDDCQALVKKAFLDSKLNTSIRLTSANSINISRLIPQSFYYFEAFKQIEDQSKVVFTVPSGNFGNLTAGVLAAKMGLPVHQFVAATNINDIVPSYLQTGEYEPRPSKATVSNAMDVGNPSNFVRLHELNGSTWNILSENVKGYSYSDDETLQGVKEVYDQFNYVIDPHGAIGYLAAKQYNAEYGLDTTNIILETAHPSKFISEVEPVIGKKVNIPERLSSLADLPKQATKMNIEFNSFKSWLLDNF